MRDEVNVTAADTEMAMRVCNWTESEARTHLHKHEHKMTTKQKNSTTRVLFSDTVDC